MLRLRQSQPPTRVVASLLGPQLPRAIPSQQPYSKPKASIYLGSNCAFRFICVVCFCTAPTHQAARCEGLLCLKRVMGAPTEKRLPRNAQRLVQPACSASNAPAPHGTLFTCARPKRPRRSLGTQAGHCCCHTTPGERSAPSPPPSGGQSQSKGKGCTHKSTQFNLHLVFLAWLARQEQQAEHIGKAGWLHPPRCSHPVLLLRRWLPGLHPEQTLEHSWRSLQAVFPDDL